jgi:hypothetical protein
MVDLQSAIHNYFPNPLNTFHPPPRPRLLKLKSNLARFALNAPVRGCEHVSVASAADRIPVSIKRRIAHREVRRPHRPGAAESTRPPGFNEFPNQPMP